MISERNLRLAKAIVDPYIGQDIIATAVLGTKLGSVLNENAYREVVNTAQRLIDETESIPRGKTLEFILRKRYVETIKAAREAFFERKDAEREQGKSLGAKAASARGASEKLDGQSQAAPAKDNLEH